MGIVITLSYAGRQNNLQIILTINLFSYGWTSPFYIETLLSVNVLYFWDVFKFFYPAVPLLLSRAAGAGLLANLILQSVIVLARMDSFPSFFAEPV
jgi:hypothetical protein